MPDFEMENLCACQGVTHNPKREGSTMNAHSIMLSSRPDPFPLNCIKLFVFLSKFPHSHFTDLYTVYVKRNATVFQLILFPFLFRLHYHVVNFVAMERNTAVFQVELAWKTLFSYLCTYVYSTGLFVRTYVCPFSAVKSRFPHISACSLYVRTYVYTCVLTPFCSVSLSCTQLWISTQIVCLYAPSAVVHHTTTRFGTS